MLGYQKIKQKAKERGCSVKDLYVLDRDNDPYYMGTPAERAKGEWFAEVWERFGFGEGVHLRRIHYKLLGQVEKRFGVYEGEVYQNTYRDWNYLTRASQYARYLGLVPIRAFVDRRNPDPITMVNYHEKPDPDYTLYRQSGAFIERPSLPFLSVDDDSFDGAIQPYHLEVWAEKTTMNDVLLPICQKYETNLITGKGEMSVTACIDLIDRAAAAQRPARVFYISDYDPAGVGMPISVARKAQWMTERMSEEKDTLLDIRIIPLVLTRAQVEKYELPRNVIDEEESRKENFEDVYGEGSVELDALEALHPGALDGIVGGAILEYYDETLERKKQGRKIALRQDLKAAQQEALEDMQDEIDAFYEDFDEMCDKLQERLDELSDKVIERLEDVEIDLDEYQIPQGKTANENEDPLFDSLRSHWDQLRIFKEKQGRDALE